MNKVFLIGRLTADPKQGQTPGNKVYTRFSLAVNRIGSEDVDFINVIAWEKKAEVLIKYATKGKQISIVGKIQTGSYDKDGVKHSTFEVVVDEIELLGSAQNSDSSSKNNRDSSIDRLREIDVDDDDMPF